MIIIISSELGSTFNCIQYNSAYISTVHYGIPVYCPIYYFWSFICGVMFVGSSPSKSCSPILAGIVDKSVYKVGAVRACRSVAL